MRLKPICFIAARGGSKGVPRKNLKSIGGQLFELKDFDTSVYSNKITLEMEKDL